jgi:hypothetical protein
MLLTQISYTTRTSVTRFYLHNATTTVTGMLPSTTDLSSARNPNVTATGASINRVMNGTIGALQTSAALTTKNSTSTQFNWFRRFVSPPLAAQTLPTGTWTLQAGASESNTDSNMLGWYQVIVVFRPSNGVMVATLNDAMTSITTEPGTSETNISQSTNSISGVAVQEGDVLVLEVWAQNTQGAKTAYTNRIYYDGTTEGSTSSNAAYLDAPGPIVLDKTAPTNQNTVFAAYLTVKGGATITIASSGDASNTVWFAPAGTTTFTAGPTITTAGGTATSILAPATEGIYKLYVLDSAGNISNPSTATLTVDTTAPSLSWIAPPCGQPPCYYNVVSNQTIQLEVNASYNVGISKVVFMRHYAAWTPITTLYNPPYSFNFDTSVLLSGWNEIYVMAYDTANNVADSYIFLNYPWQIYLPLISR